MIAASSRPSTGAVARHYDELDEFYRGIWGEHVHHGLWLRGDEDTSQAVLQLAEAVAERARVLAGMSVCDIGCGYGATARLLAKSFGARVTAVTVTPRQFEYAQAVEPNSPNPSYVLRDWLDNGLTSESFDAAIAIESVEHMADPRRAFSEAARVLKRGGRLVVCAWLAGDQPTTWQKRHLLERICVEGRLPRLATMGEFRQWMEESGWHVERFEDFSDRVRRTWPICLGRMFKELCRRPAWRRYLLRRENENRVFALTMIRIWWAYWTGAMRYGVFTARLD